MNLTIKVPDTLVGAIKKTGSFLTQNGSLVLTAAGVAINFAATGLAFYWAYKDEKNRCFAITGDEEEKASKDMKRHLITVAAMSVAANAAIVGGAIIDRHRIKSLTKTLATVANALPIAALAVADGSTDNNTTSVSVAADKFSIGIEELGFEPTDIDDYGRINTFENTMTNVISYMLPKDEITWNALIKKVTNKKKTEPFGYTIGWRSKDDIQYVYLDSSGALLTPDEARLKVVNEQRDIRLLFTNLTSLVDRVYKPDQVVAPDIEPF